MDFSSIQNIFSRQNLPVLITLLIALAIFIGAIYSGTLLDKARQSDTLSEQEKLEILENLTKISPIPPPSFEQERILKNLSSQSGEYQYSEEGKLQILQGLERQSN